MSKTILLSAAMVSMFPTSGKAISEKMSTEEYASFTEEAGELNTRLETQATANGLVVADLATANASVTELTANLAIANASIQAVTGQLNIATVDRDKYKAHHDKIAEKGDTDPEKDANSRLDASLSSYNQHAINAFNTSRAK